MSKIKGKGQEGQQQHNYLSWDSLSTKVTILSFLKIISYLNSLSIYQDALQMLNNLLWLLWFQLKCKCYKLRVMVHGPLRPACREVIELLLSLHLLRVTSPNLRCCLALVQSLATLQALLNLGQALLCELCLICTPTVQH